MNAHETCATVIILVHDFSTLITAAKSCNNTMPSSTVFPTIARKSKSLNENTKQSLSSITTMSATTTCSSIATTVINNTS